ncbi:MAG: heme NO-binding domain-containing protein, partial [Planctomycetota bacterium]
MHGLIFFYIQKFAESLPKGLADASVAGSGTSSIVRQAGHYLPSGSYPDGDAMALLQAVAAARGEPLGDTVTTFGEFLAPHLVKVAGQLVDPAWRTLDLVEHTEELIHAMIRVSKPGAEPPVLEAVRNGPQELHLVYSSRRRLCLLATGLVRGLARHFGETVEIEEPGCMLRGDPFCSFVIRVTGPETHASRSPLFETVVLPPGSASVAAEAVDADQGVMPDDGGVADDPVPDAIGGHRIL